MFYIGFIKKRDSERASLMHYSFEHWGDATAIASRDFAKSEVPF